MSGRAASISTKTGDGGMTDLQGARLSKADPRVEALGALDELDAVLADAQSVCTGETEEIIEAVRNEIFYALMPALNLPRIDSQAGSLSRLETWIAQFEEVNSAKGFVRNWNGPAALKLNIARTICRRAERRAAAADRSTESLLAYLNRLSDLLFLLSNAR
ncbi:MAG: ATP:cob(I)alamin adenosyltransferase [Treponema sp.]|jgi:cob(I)alamin adenosyltransferase|nr:ATP:cob(I)alamin adenosyltransferase [Treponema sp.]